MSWIEQPQVKLNQNKQDATNVRKEGQISSSGESSRSRVLTQSDSLRLTPQFRNLMGSTPLISSAFSAFSVPQCLSASVPQCLSASVPQWQRGNVATLWIFVSRQ